MNTTTQAVTASNRAFVRLALATGLFLLVLLALQLTIGTGVDGQGFNWRPSDFVAMGALIIFTGATFVLAAQKLPRKYWLALKVLLALAFFYLWAELAVGLFFNFGS